MTTPTVAMALEALNNLYSAATKHGWRESPATSFATVTAFIESSGADARQIAILDMGMGILARQAQNIIATNSRDLDDWREDVRFMGSQARDIRDGAVIARTDPTYGTPAYRPPAPCHRRRSGRHA